MFYYLIVFLKNKIFFLIYFFKEWYKKGVLVNIFLRNKMFLGVVFEEVLKSFFECLELEKIFYFLFFF